ncbi:MAG: hypothetical protein F4Y03_16255 [Alphaproteobacteria bacterium]|nr:hypothetical protein [Alphaproteobacteria bacterium]
MPEPQQTHDGWWAGLDAWADTVAIWAALLCVLVFVLHVRTHPRGFRDKRLVGACLAGAAVSIIYRCST